MERSNMKTFLIVNEVLCWVIVACVITSADLTVSDNYLAVILYTYLAIVFRAIRPKLRKR